MKVLHLGEQGCRDDNNPPTTCLEAIQNKDRYTQECHICDHGPKPLQGPIHGTKENGVLAHAATVRWLIQGTFAQGVARTVEFVRKVNRVQVNTIGRKQNILNVWHCQG